MLEHSLTHIPFRSWCECCVGGKATEDYHRARKDKESPGEIPRVDLDYCFMKAALANVPETLDDLEPKNDQDRAQPVLVMIDQQTGCVFASTVLAKGSDPFSIQMILEGLRFLGHGKIILQCDGEHAIKSLRESVRERWSHGASIRVTPKGSHQSNGTVERAILQVARQVRTLKMAFEANYPTINMVYDHKLFPWLVRHSAWLLTRYTVKQDGKTPYERLRGRSYKGEITEFGEGVRCKNPVNSIGKLDSRVSPGLWVGKSLASDEHLVATVQGIRKCRSVYRRPDSKRHDIKWVEQASGLPWQPRGVPVLSPDSTRQQLGDQPGLPESQQDSAMKVYITIERQYKYGQTPNCPGCKSQYGVYRPHTKECKERFRNLLAEEQKEEPKEDILRESSPIHAEQSLSDSNHTPGYIGGDEGSSPEPRGTKRESPSQVEPRPSRPMPVREQDLPRGINVLQRRTLNNWQSKEAHQHPHLRL